jgi:hypothetical protein
MSNETLLLTPFCLSALTQPGLRIYQVGAVGPHAHKWFLSESFWGGLRWRCGSVFRLQKGQKIKHVLLNLFGEGLILLPQGFLIHTRFLTSLRVTPRDSV